MSQFLIHIPPLYKWVDQVTHALYPPPFQFCWGGKVIALTSQAGTSFKAVAQCHPAMIDPNEALTISIPLCMLASKDEPVDNVKKFEENLRGEKYVEIFSDQIHGWMAARSDLADPRVKAEYERGYKTLLQFFAKYCD
jgi:dienelactone hydrolase